jgi:hypothetical protein
MCLALVLSLAGEALRLDALSAYLLLTTGLFK